MRTASARLSPAVPAVLLLLRLVAGLIMAYHGLGKFQGGISNFAGGVEALGFPAPTLVAWLVALLELLGGLMVAVGLFSRVAAALIAVEMLITGVYVKLITAGVGFIAPGDQPGAGAEVDFLYLVAFLTVAALGPGRYSLDAAMGREESEPARSTRAA